MKTDVIREELRLARVKLEQVRYRHESSSFKIAVMHVSEGGNSGLTGKRITVRGNLPDEIKIGEELDLTVLEEEHDKYGIQYNLLNWGKALPMDEDGLRKYFIKNFTGIGEKRARTLLVEFGSGILHLLDGDAEKAVQAICEKLKWAESAAESFVKQWQEAILPKRIEFLLLGAGLSAKAIHNIKEHFGDSFTETVGQNPYKLTKVSGVGFATADRIALRQGVNKNSPFRIWSGVSHLLLEAAKKGDCYLPEYQMFSLASKLLQIPIQEVRAALEGKQPEDEPIYVDSDRNYWNYFIYRDEQMAAEYLVSLMQTKSGFPEELSEYDWNKFFTGFQLETGIELTSEQKAAVRQALRDDVLIITGNPGTGKTTILKAILSVLESLGSSRVSLCAPTGKAARRMNEACGRETSTIHRLLGIGAGEGGYSYLNPLPSDVVVVDEVSMIDISLFAALVTSIKRSAKLILIGDKDQLASIGAGRVLADLLEAGIPHIRLTQPQRQAQNSFIVKLAHAINRGKLPDLPDVGSKENVWFAPVTNEDDAVRALGELMERLESLGFNTEKVKSLSPQKKGECGVFALNRYLQGIINAPHRTKKEALWKMGIIREDDLLIQLKNDRILDLMNGEEVRVTGLSEIEKDQELEVIAEIESENGNQLSIPISEMEMQHAFALTVHKAQGSEWDVVILFCLSSQMGFYSRRMLYTGLTRAKKLAIVIGDTESLKIVIGREFEARRRTKLTERLRQLGQLKSERTTPVARQDHEPIFS